jgi:hypothetical protein
MNDKENSFDFKKVERLDKKFRTTDFKNNLVISQRRKRSIKWDLSEIKEEKPRSNETSPKPKQKRQKKLLEIDPYIHIDNPDELYLQRLNEVIKTPPSKDFLENMTKKVFLANQEHEKETCLESIVSEGINNYLIIETLNENVNKKETYPKKLIIEDNDDQILEETMQNTLYNKYVGKIQTQNLLEKD